MRQVEVKCDLLCRGREIAQREGDGAAVLVFDHEREIVVAQNGRAEFEDLQQLAGVQAVINVGRDQQLQLAVEVGARRASAIDEVLLHATDFGDVKVSGHDVIVRKDDV